MNEEKRPVRDFAVFKKSLEDIAVASLNDYDAAYRRKGKSERMSSEEIDQILIRDNATELRNLSRNYVDLSGVYKRFIEYMSNMLTYDTLIIPKMDFTKLPEKERVLKALNSACYFVDGLNLKQELPRIFSTILTDGVYFGFFKESEDGKKAILQDLAPEYCRTRYKSINGLPILEFDLSYFIVLEGMSARTKVDELKLYPKFVRDAYYKYFKNIVAAKEKETVTISAINNQALLIDKSKLADNRWLIIPEHLGVVFYYKEEKPFFASVIKAIEELNEYKGIERALDKQELAKILMQKIPTDSKGELVFTLEEAAEIHKAAVKMLRNNPNVDVFTTLADTEMLELQDSSQTNRDNLEKMERSIFNEAGVSKNLFASEGTVALEYAQVTDFTIVGAMAEMFSTFLTYHVNRKFAEKKFFLEVTILPITHYNREKMFDLYLKGAQYGYSKFLPGVAAGIKQSNLLNLNVLENDFLDLSNKMVPLQSSHTTSGKEGKGATDEGGAPEKDEMQKSDKTRQRDETR